MSISYQPIANSQINFQAALIHQADPNLKLEIVVHLNRQQREEADNAEELDLIYGQPQNRKYLDHKSLAELFGPSEEESKTIIDYFGQFGIKKESIQPLARTISFSGTAQALNEALRTQLDVFEGPDRMTFVAYKGCLSVPSDIHPYIQSISGLTKVVKTEYRLPTRTKTNQTSNQDVEDMTKGKGFWTKELMEAYNFPKNLTGKGQTIAIIELGGVYRKSDITAYFKKVGLKVPKIIEVGIPADDKSIINNSEVTLDIEVIGTVAPDAKFIIYYGHTILEAMQMIIADTKNKPSVVSISWAGSESNYSSYQIAGLNEVFYQAALLGITVIAASGDHGAYNSKTNLNVSIPSSHPLVIGCGGTSPSLDSQEELQSTKVWNQHNDGTIGSGGGFSSLYTLPYYQHTAVANYPYFRGSTRGVPDIAANADSENGYIVVFNGMEMPIGGTSAATPLWAGLIALMNEALGYRLGFINHLLYQMAGSEAFVQVLVGNNGYYPAAAYWNPATGLGAPNGEKLLEAFGNLG